MLYKIVGIQSNEFMARDTGELVQGYNVHFISELSGNGVGFGDGFRKFISKRVMDRFGGYDNFSAHLDQLVNLQFDPNGRLVGIEF